MSTDAESRTRAAFLARACFAFNGFVLANIALGALVRAHGAGLACPDWPLCFGEAIPRFDFKVAWEVGHRYVVTVLSAGFAAIGLGVLWSSEIRRVAGRLWGIALGLLLLQVLLGATTVWFQLAAWSVTAHLIVGNAWNAAVLWMGLSLRAHALNAAPSASLARGVKLAVALSALFLFFQVALGGLVSSRSAGLACSQWPSCYGDAWFPVWGLANPIGLHVHHRANGYLLAGFVAWMAWAARGIPRLAGRARLALALVALQMAIGIANVLLQLRVEITALHTAMAGALVLTLTSCAHAVFAKESR